MIPTTEQAPTMRFITLFLLLTACSAHSQVLRRCVDEVGHVTFTNTGACPKGTVDEQARIYTPEPDRRSRQSAPVRRSAPARRVDEPGLYYSTPRPSRTRSWRDDCREAKEQVRAQQLATKRPTFMDYRRWNDIEHGACKGRDPNR